MVDGDSRLWRQALQVAEQLSPHPNLITGLRIQSVQNQSRDVAWRPTCQFHAVGESPRGQADFWSPVGRLAFKAEERNVPAPAFFPDLNFVFPEVGDGLALLVECDERKLNQAGRRPEDRGLHLAAKKERRRRSR